MYIILLVIFLVMIHASRTQVRVGTQTDQLIKSFAFRLSCFFTKTDGSNALITEEPICRPISCSILPLFTNKTPRIPPPEAKTPDPDLVENRGFRLRGTDFHPSSLTLCRNPPQCTLKVLAQRRQQNQMICIQQRWDTLWFPNCKLSSTRLHLENLFTNRIGDNWWSPTGTQNKLNFVPKLWFLL